MKKQLISLSVVILSLFGCTNTVEQTQYYLLLNQPVVSAVAKPALAEQNFHVAVKLADYLQKPYLVMQIGAQQIHYSFFHLWAEPLNKGINNALLYEFNLQNPVLSFVEESAHTLAKRDNTVLVEINYFHITDSSKVLLSGHYRVNNQGQITQQSFMLQEPLSEDGYPHAVSKMRQLLTLLAEQIKTSL